MLAIGFVWLAPPLHAQFAYVVNDGGFNVSAYSIAAGGALIPIPGSPFAAGEFPYSMAVDPTGKFAYATNESSNNVSAYRIGADGVLTPVKGSPFKAGNFPNSVTVDPTGQFAYTANNSSSNVSAYSIGADGSLTQLANSPFVDENTPVALAITPLVPFASSFAKLKIESELSTFHLSDSFSLGANSNGITPTTQKLTLHIGTFTITIPSGSFKKRPTGNFFFKTTINGGTLSLRIVPLGANMFTFNLYGVGINLGGLTEPVTVVLTIGIDSGTIKVRYTQ